jgi:bifunctional DNA-binding transcriptional regulator/antitoxin component of YhaV-PrlF toxin-antitoxin module
LVTRGTGVPRKEVAITKLFGNGKTTIPRDVREFLHITDIDRVVWYIDTDTGFACIRRAEDRTRQREPI